MPGRYCGRVRSITTACAAAVIALGVAGCGGSGVRTTGTVAVGTIVPADQYLADAAQGADAVRRYVTVMQSLPTPATPVALRGTAPQLAEPLAAAEAVAQRLSAERLEDQRLEAQRTRSAAAYTDVLAGMRAFRTAAAGGNARAAAAAASDLGSATSTLRAVGDS